jgi:hypothetical protein
MSDDLTALDRYMMLADRAAGRPELAEELRTIFAENATVDIYAGEITGIEALLPFYRTFYGGMQECRHLWTTRRAGENVLEAPWVAAVRLPDGSLKSFGGFERALLNDEGLITDLRNYAVEPG